MNNILIQNKFKKNNKLLRKINKAKYFYCKMIKIIKLFKK